MEDFFSSVCSLSFQRLRRTLRECSAEWLDHGCVPIDKIVKEILRTCPELDSPIGGKDGPASVQKHRRTVCGFEDVLTCDRLGLRAEITGDSKDVGERVVLRVGHSVACQRIAELSERIVLVDDALGQIAILVIVADGVLVKCTAVEDIEGAGAAATDDADVHWTVGTYAVALADGAVSDCLAGIERRWRWVQLLRSSRMDSDEGECYQGQEQNQERTSDTEEFN